MLLTRNALGNLLARYRAVLQRCRWKNALAALLVVGAVAAPAPGWGNSGGVEIVGSTNWYIGANTASNNTVFVDDNSFTSNAAGGYSNEIYGQPVRPQGGDVRNNILTIDFSRKLGDGAAYGGYVAVPNLPVTATGNILNVFGTVVWGAAGGHATTMSSYSATATDNTLHISGSVGQDAYGAFVDSLHGDATAKENTMTIESGGKVIGNAYGAHASSQDSQYGNATATGNTLTIKSGSSVSNGAYGGEATASASSGNCSATATGNTLHISGSVGQDAYGGRAVTESGVATATKNTVTIENGGSVRGNAYGGYVEVRGAGSSSGTATGNTVLLNGGSFGTDKCVYGGYVNFPTLSNISTGNVTDNTVVLGASLGANDLDSVMLYGWGFENYGSGTVTVSDNTLKVEASGVTVKSINNFDNYRFATNALSTTTTALTLDKQPAALIIDADRVSFDTSKGGLSMNFGETATLLKSNAAITLSGSGQQIGHLDNKPNGLPETVHNLTLTAPGDSKLNVSFSEVYLYGSGGSNTPGQREKGNTLTLDGNSGKATAAFGGRASTGVDVTGNTLIVDGPATLVQLDPSHSRYELSGKAYGGYADAGNATGNTLEVRSDAQMVAAYGGYAASGNATDNTVILSNSLTGKTLSFPLYGGYSASGGEAVAGNTLELWGHGVSAPNIHNFANLYFVLPAGIKPGGTVLTLNGGAPTVFNTKANVGVAVAAGAQPLKTGDSVTLLKNASGLHNAAGGQLVQGTDYQKVSLEGKTLKGRQGISLEYDFTLSNTDTTLDATIPADPNPLRAETKAIVEARAAAAAVLNGAGDLAAGNGIRNALAGFASPQGQSGMASGDATGIAAHVIPFAAVSGGWQRVETGSHANISGLAAMVGLAGQVQFAAANFLAGAFFEFGTSRMDTHNSFASGDVDGKGHASYTGGGILARLDVTESLLRGLYVEGTFRFGGLNSDWHTDDLRDAATGRRAQFDMYAPYIGGHAGLGYVWQATDSLKLDVYGKYLWTRLYGDDAMVALDRYEFDTVDSQRLRLGARLDWQFSESASVYVGAAWEHEFNGEARATTYGMETPAPTMEGDTGVFDLGLSFTPAPNLTVEAGLTGYAGMRQGIGGNVLVKYSF